MVHLPQCTTIKFKENERGGDDPVPGCTVGIRSCIGLQDRVRTESGI